MSFHAQIWVHPFDCEVINMASVTHVETVVSCTSSEALQQVVKMGLKDGLTSTLARLDEFLLTLN